MNNTLENSLLTVILSSAVISAIIAALFNWFQHNKKINVENITAERKQWRNELRKCLEKLESASDKQQANMSLVKLKCRINSYGYNDKENYLCDGHIWDVIKEIENLPNNSNKKFKKLKKKLIN